MKKIFFISSISSDLCVRMFALITLSRVFRLELVYFYYFGRKFSSLSSSSSSKASRSTFLILLFLNFFLRFWTSILCASVYSCWYVLAISENILSCSTCSIIFLLVSVSWAYRKLLVYSVKRLIGTDSLRPKHVRMHAVNAKRNTSEMINKMGSKLLFSSIDFCIF